MSTVVLEKKLVKVQPINRSNGYFEENQDGGSIFTNAKFTFNLPILSSTKQFVKILDETEQEFFAKKLNLKLEDLDFYNRESKFWTNLRVELDKEGLLLDLSDPIDNLKWRILKVFPSIAPSWKERFEDGRYRFALVEEGYEASEINKKADKTKRAWKAFGKIEDSMDKMIDVLEIYGKNVSKTSSKDWLQAEITKLIEDAKPKAGAILAPIDEFLAIVEDPNYETRLFITKAVRAGALRKIGKHAYKLPGTGEKDQNTADNLDEMIEFLKNPENNAIVAKMRAHINNK